MLHERSAAPAQAVRGGQLRRARRDADRGRAVRPRARRLHRRGHASARGASRRPTAAPCSSTRSASCRCRRRPSCCACCRRGPSSRWAPTPPRRSTCASSPPPTATSSGGRPRACSARTSTTGSTCSSSSCRRCASGRAICRCWSSTSCSASPPRAAAARRCRRRPGRRCRSYAYPGQRARVLPRHRARLHPGGRPDIDLHHLPPVAGPLRSTKRPTRSAATCRPLRPLSAGDQGVRARVPDPGGPGRRRPPGRAAEMLGISRKSLWEKLRAYGIAGDDDRDEGATAV